MTACSENFYCRDDFDAALAIFCYYCYVANATEAIEKIVTDEENVACAL